MQIKTILNRIQKYRGFVYGPMRLHGQGATLRLEVEIYPHLRNRPRCVVACNRPRCRSARASDVTVQVTAALAAVKGPPVAADDIESRRSDRRAH